MNMQIDFGNLAVGIGTVALAIVTFIISQRNLRQQKKQKIAEFRVEWIDGFRRDVSSLFKIQYEISAIKKGTRAHQNANLKSRVEQLYYESSELKTRLLLRLKKNSENKDEAELEKLLKSAISSNPDKAVLQRAKIRDLSRSILKTEWNKVRSEIES